MGVSTDGQICFGNVYEDGFKFPWFKDGEAYGDIEDWWRKENGFDDPIHDASGNWIGGIRPTQEAYDNYFAKRKEFDAAHPLPVKEINYCSGDYPMWILAVPSSCHSNSRGEALAFNPAELVVTDAEKAALREFCVKYDLIPIEDAAWYLTSYWG